MKNQKHLYRLFQEFFQNNPFLLEKALMIDPTSEQRVEAHVWLSEINDDPVEKRDHLENALSINAAHPTARRKLAILDGRLKPEEIIIDEKNKGVAVILRVQFREEPTGTVFPAKHNCAHYQLVEDKSGELKIKKISYFAEHRPPDEPDMKTLMKKYREQALSF